MPNWLRELHSASFSPASAMLWMIPVPYTLNAPYWFLFYPFYPKDVETQQARERKRLLKGPPDLLIA